MKEDEVVVDQKLSPVSLATVENLRGHEYFKVLVIRMRQGGVDHRGVD